MPDKQRVIALIQAQRWAEAKTLCAQLCQANGNDAEVWFLLGVALQNEGMPDTALEHYRKALSLRPQYPEAHYNLGTALQALARPNDAMAHFQEAVRLRPGMTSAAKALGHLLRGYGHSDKAIAACQDALRYQPDDPELYVQLAVLFMDIGRQQEAEDNIRAALELRPGDPGICAMMAQVLEQKGDFEGAYAVLRPSLDNGEDNASVALAYATLAKHIDQRDQAAKFLEHALRGNKTIEERKRLHFALGKLYDEAKEYDQAFRHYHSANELGKGRFDAEKSAQRFDNMKAVFSAENTLTRRLRASNKSRLPVFIVGMPRSATSLVEQILASHPEMHGAGELQGIRQIITALPALAGAKTPYPQCVTALKQNQIDEMAQLYLATLGKFSRTATRVTDKMPHNFAHLGLIDMLFPGARVIHCLRDPLDNCLSIYSLPFIGNHPYASDLTSLGIYYRQYQSLMAHWKQVLRIPILEVRYEELVADPEVVIRQMVDFCGLKWNPCCLAFHATGRVVSTPSYDQVRRPIYKESVARWKNYERHLGPLIAALGIENKVDAK